MKKYIFLLILMLSLNLAFGQTEIQKDTNYWQFKSIFGVNGTQTSFVNWSAGGRNNISALAFLDASLKYQEKNIKWSNDLKLALGGMKFIDSLGIKDGLQKTDDKIDFATSFGYEFKKKWFYTIVSGFKTQMLDGYVFPNDSIRVSKFMAPGYLSSALGIEFAPNENFNLFLSPLAAKITFVRDERLANAGAFGVEKALYDGTGQLLKAGETQRNEIGSYLKLRYNRVLMTNIEMKSRLELFSNYLNNPENIDINAEVVFAFKVNKWFSATLQWNLLYDDDIKVRDSKGRTGPRTQFKSVLGLGIAYTLKNYEEKKK